MQGDVHESIDTIIRGERQTNQLWLSIGIYDQSGSDVATADAIPPIVRCADHRRRGLFRKILTALLLISDAK